ncbi:NBS-LRR type disease resistance protein [Striga asiatica]|uniref:NBS-LRR type disease resistance protein n=1 Tax=Striga asiatica TaxID=4170 RepID=A0A5A7PZC5_STRAF|nr:NBS-LRR type disease resistance protein [Striga asiatica]
MNVREEFRKLEKSFFTIRELMSIMEEKKFFSHGEEDIQFVTKMQAFVMRMDPFGCIIWVYVGQYFDSVRILRYIMEQLTQKECNFSDLNALQNSQRPSPARIRRLLEYGAQDWDTLVLPLESTAYGSFVIVTTRSSKMDRVQAGFLSDHDCCGLVEQIAVPSFNIPDEIRSVIESKCGGLPLAATSLGTVPSSAVTTQLKWEFVLRDDTWETPQGRIVLDSLSGEGTTFVEELPTTPISSAPLFPILCYVPGFPHF